MTNTRSQSEFVTVQLLASILYHIFVIDASQSMTDPDWPPSRLEAAWDATMAYIGRLIMDVPTSSVAVVCFSETAHVICPWTEVGSLQDLDAVRAEWLQASREHGMGNTNMGDGLQEALLLAAERKGSTQVVLLTDGHHNTGLAPARVSERLQSLATIAVVGIGGAETDVDEHMLQTIASTGADGRPCYRWIGKRDALVVHFEQLAGRLTRE